ncbi:MAG: hypothetical protein GX376_02090 [Firmicutes bacterium]|nr:hypothetical protein [Bacillota bacterium]
MVISGSVGLTHTLFPHFALARQDGIKIYQLDSYKISVGDGRLTIA